MSLLTRLLVDTGVQFFNSYLPIVAEGLRTRETVVGALVSLRSITGLLSPFFGQVADRRGYIPIMRLGLLIAAGGALLTGASVSIAMAAVGMLVWGVGLAAFLPSLQAYLSTRLPYNKRARGIGIVEYVLTSLC